MTTQTTHRLRSSPPALATASSRQAWEYVAPLCIGIYGADLHKLSINTGAVLFSSPLAWKDIASGLDIVLACLVILFSATGILASKHLPRGASIPVLSQFMLVGLMSIGLWRHFDEISLLHYKRFIGGNLSLFLGAVFVCTRTWKIRLIWNVWLATALLQAFIAIWYWREGYLWTSIRATLIPGTGIRMGYQCAIAFIYTLLANGNKDLKSIAMCCLFAFGVLMSGSKMALLLTVGIGSSMFLFEMLKTRQIALSRILIFTVSAVAIVQILFVIAWSEKEGFHKYVLDLEQYVSSVENREELNDEFYELALKHPIMGSGISAGYYEISGDKMQTTHSAVQATFLQLGIPGLVSYLVLVLFLGLSGFSAIRRTQRSFDSRFYISMATYAAFIMMVLKAEVTSDLPGNRELWMFSGLLIHCLNRLQNATLIARKEWKPCAELQAA